MSPLYLGALTTFPQNVKNGKIILKIFPTENFQGKTQMEKGRRREKKESPSSNSGESREGLPAMEADLLLRDAFTLPGGADNFLTGRANRKKIF
jgi:hypothetical protein